MLILLACFVIAGVLIYFLAVVNAKPNLNKAESKIESASNSSDKNTKTASTESWRSFYVKDNKLVDILKDDMKLTDEALKILDDIDVVSVIDDQEEIHQECSLTYRGNSYILYGCYVYTPQKDELFIYNDLDIKSTFAHEFLHAAYVRLSSSEKAELKALLKTTHSENKAVLDSLLATYDTSNESILLNELHSFVATHISKPPADLNHHYNQYFKDRGLIMELSADDTSGLPIEHKTALTPTSQPQSIPKPQVASAPAPPVYDDVTVDLYVNAIEGMGGEESVWYCSEIRLVGDSDLLTDSYICRLSAESLGDATLKYWIAFNENGGRSQGAIKDEVKSDDCGIYEFLGTDREFLVGNYASIHFQGYEVLDEDSLGASRRKILENSGRAALPILQNSINSVIKKYGSHYNGGVLSDIEGAILELVYPEIYCNSI